MKIYFSPYFNGHTYVDYDKRKLIGEVIESEAGLLSRLELMCGMAYPDDDSDKIEKERVAEYYDALTSSVEEGQPLYDSIQNDDKKTQRYNVTTELLRWRDNLIMAGWNKTDDLLGKLSVISNTEKNVQKDGFVSDGNADRWLRLTKKVTGIKDNVVVELRCPKILIPKLIQEVIDQLESSDYEMETRSDTQVLNNCQVISFNELYKAYEWLAQQEVKAKQVIVCNDGDRLDNVMNCLGKPITSKDANVGCHHVVTDVRSMLDTPESLIWIDCNGGYGFRYEYDFISGKEKSNNMPASVVIPDESQMIKAVHNHYVKILNSIPAGTDGTNVTLVSSACDTGKALTQHPMVACALKAKGGKPDVENPETPIDKDENKKHETDIIRFIRKTHYNFGENIDVNARMSYSALNTLIQTPFNHMLEKELNLYEPFNDEDIRTIKGKVAHKVVELMVKKNNGTLDINLFDYYFDMALKDNELVDKSIGKCVLDLPENKFEKEDLEFNLRKSISTLISIIDSNSLEIVGSEVAIPENGNEYTDESKKEKFSVNMPVFGKCVAFLDMILKEKGTKNYYIFDFKYSNSHYYADKLEHNKSIQFAFYMEIFDRFLKKEGATLNGIGYYLFPKCVLYMPDSCQHILTGDSIELVHVDYSEVKDTFKSIQVAYEYRKQQFAEGVIEEGEQMAISTIEDEEQKNFGHKYSDKPDIFPIDQTTSPKGNKEGPYSANHIVLKNQIR